MYMTAATTAKHWAESTLRQHPARARGHFVPNFCHAHTKSPHALSRKTERENRDGYVPRQNGQHFVLLNQDQQAP
jgi:hypothetical protein